MDAIFFPDGRVNRLWLTVGVVFKYPLGFVQTPRFTDITDAQ